MGLLGKHSQNPNGNPSMFAQMQSVPQAILQRIAAGGKLTKAESQQYFGINGEADFSNPSHAEENAATRQYATALLSGNTQQAQALAQQAGATHKDWTGGTLAKLAPIAVGLIPGVGIPAAAALGGGLGALESKAGLTNTSVLGGAASGAALAGGSAAARKAAGSLLNRPASGGSQYGDAPVAYDANGRNVDTGELRPSAAGSGSGLLERAGQLISGGASALTKPGVLQTGLGILGAIQGAQRQGQANDLRAQGLASLTPNAAPDLSSLYADPGNPYARQPVAQTALASARNSLRGY